MNRLITHYRNRTSHTWPNSLSYILSNSCLHSSNEDPTDGVRSYISVGGPTSGYEDSLFGLAGRPSGLALPGLSTPSHRTR